MRVNWADCQEHEYDKLNCICRCFVKKYQLIQPNATNIVAFQYFNTMFMKNLAMLLSCQLVELLRQFGMHSSSTKHNNAIFNTWMI
jgi:hypothetical protein